MTNKYDYRQAQIKQEGYCGHHHRGVLFLADISGYTNLLTSTELEKSAKITHYITEKIFEATHEPFIVNEVEGDALYVYTVQGNLSDEELFMATLKQLEAYSDAFYHAMEDLSWSNLRDDSEFRQLMSNISLKFAVHYGEFTIKKIGDFCQIIGPDGILVHRLLKNQVDSDSYFLFTSKFLALDEDMEHAKAMAHVEEVKHFGAIDVGVRVFDFDKEHQARHGEEHDYKVNRDLII